jgi:hypothetical protein
MSTVESFRGISIWDKVVCIVSNYDCYGKIGIVNKININEGAENGWFEGEFDDGGFFLAGEEIRKY